MTILLIAAAVVLTAVLTFAATVWAVANGKLEVWLIRNRKEYQPIEIMFFRWGFTCSGGTVSDFYVQWKAAK
jgi:hypothetical protein